MYEASVPDTDHHVVPALGDIAPHAAPITLLYDAGLPAPLRIRDTHHRPVAGPGREVIESTIETIAATIAATAPAFEVTLLRAEVAPTRTVGAHLDPRAVAHELSQIASTVLDGSRDRDTAIHVLAWITWPAQSRPHLGLSATPAAPEPAGTLPTSVIARARWNWTRIARTHLLAWGRDSGLRQLRLRARLITPAHTPLPEHDLATR